MRTSPFRQETTEELVVPRSIPKSMVGMMSLSSAILPGISRDYDIGGPENDLPVQNHWRDRLHDSDFAVRQCRVILGIDDTGRQTRVIRLAIERAHLQLARPEKILDLPQGMPQRCGTGSTKGGRQR